MAVHPDDRFELLEADIGTVKPRFTVPFGGKKNSTVNRGAR